MFLLDEAGFVEDGMYYDVLFPLWSVGDCVAFLISSPPKHYSPLIDMITKTHPKTGEKLVLQYILDMVCNSCKKRKKRIKTCKHVRRMYFPEHQSEEKVDIAAIMYRDQTSFEREFQGRITEDDNSIIEEGYMKAFVNRRMWRLDKSHSIRHVLITCDPNTKGDSAKRKGSDMSLLATTCVNGFFVIVGMESYPTKPVSEVTTLLHGFVNAVKTHPALNGANIIFCCERNMAHESGWMAVELMEKHGRHRIIPIAKDGDDDWGWFTREEEKMEYAIAANKVFSIGNIAYMEDLICTCPWIKGDKVKAIKEKFEIQLRSYSPKLKPDKTTDGKNDIAFNLTFNLSLYHKILGRTVKGLDYERLNKSVY